MRENKEIRDREGQPYLPARWQPLEVWKYWGIPSLEKMDYKKDIPIRRESSIQWDVDMPTFCPLLDNIGNFSQSGVNKGISTQQSSIAKC